MAAMVAGPVDFLVQLTEETEVMEMRIMDFAALMVALEV
jgi:hypothetical protein